MDAAHEAPMAPRLEDVALVDLGRVKFEHAWELQRHAHQALIEGSGPETVFLCEHEPVITIGTSGSAANILVSETELARRGVSVFAIERGGDVTYHGPGQLVVYPILDLTLRRRDVHWYMRSLEEAILSFLRSYGISGFQIAGKTGVWTSRNRDGTSPEPRKIASIGVRMSRWRTLHGFAINVGSCATGFDLIHPCGMAGVKVTSLEEELRGREVPLFAEFEDAKRRVWEHLAPLLSWPAATRNEVGTSARRNDISGG